MILKLLESRRARRFAGGALAASTAVHLGFAGAAARGPQVRSADEPEPISIRYLLPPRREPTVAVEGINWVALGPGTNGWTADPAGAGDGPPADVRDKKPKATEPPEPDVVAVAPQQDQTFQDYEVDTAAERDPASGGPNYPDELRAKGVQGEVLVEFAVDTTGHADSATFSVVTSTHPEFAQAVREALPRMLFTPAVAHGRRVRQLVRLPMKFKLLAESAQGST
jgi:TonB family protein